MITFKLLIVIVAFGYAFSLPTTNVAAQNDAKTLPVTSINSSPSETTEPKLSRATRENKIEYIYLREGDSPSLLPKHLNIYSTLKDEPAAGPLPFKDDEPKKPVDPSPKHNSVEESADKLQYNGGNSKGRLENPKGRSSAPPIVPQPIVPVNPYNPLNSCVNSCLNPYHPYPTFPYPTFPYQTLPYQPYPISSLTNSLNVSPLNNGLGLNQLQLLLNNGGLSNGGGLTSLLLNSYLSNLRSSNNLDIIPGILSYYLANKAIVPLIGSALSSLILSPSLTNASPQINPFLSLILPQQTPNLNYLLKGNIDGLTGYENLISPAAISPNLISNALYTPSYYPQMPPYPILPISPGFARSSGPNPSSSSETTQSSAEPHDVAAGSSVDKRAFLLTPSVPIRTAFDPAINYQYLNAYPNRFYQPFPYPPAFSYKTAVAYPAVYPAAYPAVYPTAYQAAYPAYPNDIGFYSNFPEFARKNMDAHKSGVHPKDPSFGKDSIMNSYNNLYSMKGLKNDQSSLKEHHVYQDQPLDPNKMMMNEHKKA